MTKHEAASSSRTTTNLKSAWQTSTLLLALALALLGAQSAAAATTSVSVSAFIRPTATLSVDAQPGSVIVTADDVRRGSVDLPASSRVRVRTTSPLGLWLAQSALDAGVWVHVYPPLHEERKKLAALFTRRNDMLLRPQRQIGRGREFEKLRNYLPGDSLGDIHWKATARRGHPVTKEFRIERTQEVYCVIDASRLSAWREADRDGGAGDSLLDACVSASLLLAGIAIRQGDLFGVMTFSDQPISFIRAAGGMGHFGVCREALYQTQPSLVTPDFAETASFLASRLRRRALLLFLTSLDEPVLAEAFVRSIQVLAGRHLALVHSLSPAAAHPLFSDSGTDDADELYDRLGGHLVWHGLRRTVETLRLRGVEMALTDRERFCASLAARYLNVKRRQIL